jgi:hypothetical protein
MSTGRNLRDGIRSHALKISSGHFCGEKLATRGVDPFSDYDERIVRPYSYFSVG